MYHVILIAIAATMMLGVWNLVQSSPRAVTMLLPTRVAFMGGAALLLFGIFFAFAAAVLVQNGGAMLAFLLKAFVGFYFLLLTVREDEATVKKAFVMMGVMVLTLFGIFYAQNAYVAAILMACLLGAGYYVLNSASRFLDRQG